ncbi:probable transcription factor At5g28040 [Fagus crenata]
MNSTPTTPQEPQPPLSIKSSPRKLPIKRKTHPDSSSSNPNPNFLSPKLEQNDAVKSPPFKFHRIWSEPDEIRFLQGLRDCVSQGLSFPKDLHVFFDRFSNTMSQPYTKSQLSEKLRRLRKKFRVISSRLSRGLSPSMLSPHDRALYHLSKALWSPQFQFNNADADDDDDDKEEEEEFGLGVVGAKAVLDVFDQCLKEVRAVLHHRGLLFNSSKATDFDRRWQEQRVAELDVFACRLRLVLDNSLPRQ